MHSFIFNLNYKEQFEFGKVLVEEMLAMGIKDASIYDKQNTCRQTVTVVI
jgi:hypothetical protein